MRAPVRVRWLEGSLLLLIAASLALELRLVFTLNVNWDEFHYLSRIYELRRGALPQLFQTFHVHLFGWLSGVSSDEMSQIFAARVALLAVGLGARALVYAIARRFVGVPAALVAVLAWCCFSYVLHHGASFRFDPMLSFLSLLAVWLLLGWPASVARAAVAGAAVALSLMISLKTAFQLPTLAAVLLYGAVRSRRGPARARQSAVFGAAALSGFLALYALHAALVGATAGDAGSGEFLRRVATSFLSAELLPRAAYLTQSLRWDLPIWALLAAGFAIGAARLVRGPASERARIATLLAFALPLSSLVAYRNAFPYFYVLILAPAIVLCGIPIDAVMSRTSAPLRLRATAVLVAALLVFSGALRFAWYHREDQTLAQRELIELVHDLFPVATPYIDRCGMIATYPSVGPFISKWGLDDYREAGVPMMEEVIRRERPLFVVANVAALNVDAESVEKTAPRDRLLEPDRRALQANYVWHWSKLSVAGKSFAFARGEGARSFRMWIPGRYTVESKSPVRIDGELHPARSVVTLGEGLHSIASLSTPARVTLRYGSRLHRPQRAPVDQSIFTGFLYD